MEIITGRSEVVVLRRPDIDLGYATTRSGGPLHDVALIGSLRGESLYRYADANHVNTSFRGGALTSPKHRESEYAVWLLRMVRAARVTPGNDCTITQRCWRFEQLSTVVLHDYYSGHREIRLGRLYLSRDCSQRDHHAAACIPTPPHEGEGPSDDE